MDYNELMENAELIASKYNDKEILDMSKDLPFEQRMNFSYKIECIRIHTSYQETYASIMHREKFVENLIANNEFDYIVNNIDFIIQKSADLKDIPLSYLKRNLDKITPEQMSHIEDIITHATSMRYPNVNEEDMEKLKGILLDTAKATCGSILDIRNIGFGCSAKVFRINDRIVKVGYNRDVRDIPQNSRILYPYFKGNVGADYVEVNDFIPNIRKIERIQDVTDDDIEDMYKVYKDIRDEGLIWVDVSPNNMGTVSPEMIAKNDERKKDLSSKGIIPNPKYSDKETKDKLIIDLDTIIFEDDEYMYNILKNKMDVGKQVMLDSLEERYQAEKSKEKQENIPPARQL